MESGDDEVFVSSSELEDQDIQVMGMDRERELREMGTARTREERLGAMELGRTLAVQCLSHVQREMQVFAGYLQAISAAGSVGTEEVLDLIIEAATKSLGASEGERISLGLAIKRGIEKILCGRMTDIGSMRRALRKELAD